MTKDELGQLQALRKEVKELNKKIEELMSKPSARVTDKVDGSMSEFPYTRAAVKIEGIDMIQDKKIRTQILSKKLLLQKRQQQAEDEELRLTEYINGVEDSKVRLMMEYRYINGWSWEQIGRKFNCDRTTVEKTISKYLAKN